MSDETTGRPRDLDWLLTGLVERVTNTRSALLLSSDGLKKAFSGLDDDQADHLSAVASGMFSLARNAGTRFGNGGQVRQVVAELDDTLLFVTTAGDGAVLAVLAGRGVDAGILGYEMSKLVTSVGNYLATPARSAVGEALQ